MPLLTVRLSDEQFAALRAQAGGNVSALVKSWIAAAPKALDHRACDRVIAERDATISELRANLDTLTVKYERCRELSLFDEGSEFGRIDRINEQVWERLDAE